MSTLESVPLRAPAPYARSWVNLLIDRVARLPGPVGLAYGLAIVPAVLLVASTDWLSGSQVGVVGLDRTIWGVTLVATVWLIHHLDGVARGALRDFSRLLDATPEAVAALEYELTIIPARPALLILGLSALRTAEAFLFQPASEGLTGMGPIAIAIRAPFETIVTSLLIILIYHAVRQMRIINRLHAAAPRVNLFRPAPLYAFSRLTSQTAIGLVFLLIPFGGTLAGATSAIDYATSAILATGILGTAILAFAAPLLGMHRRMDAERRRLQSEAGQRIEALVADLHSSIDRGDLSSADGQNKTLASLIAERALVNQLSTWPWQTGTAGAVVSAVLLPIGLFLATRVLERAL